MSESLQLMCGLFTIAAAVAAGAWNVSGRLARIDAAIEKLEQHVGLRNGGGAKGPAASGGGSS